MRLVSWLLLAVIVAFLCLAIWILVPAPTLPLLLLGVGAPELSPVLLIGALALGALVMVTRRGSVRTVSMVLAVGAIAICTIPVGQYALAIQEFDEALGARRNGDVWPAAMRSSRFALREVLSGIKTDGVRTVRAMEFARPEGQPLTLTIYRPQSSGRFPIIVQIYGGAWQRGGPEDNGEFAQYFASRGYVVFAIDYRHAPKWRWPAQIEDVNAALAWIRSHAGEYDADPERLVLVGRSSGAQLALLAAYEQGAAQVSGVVSFYGPTDLIEGWRVPPRPDPLGVRSVLEAYLGGTPQQMEDRYREASPIAHVSATVPPTFSSTARAITSSKRSSAVFCTIDSEPRVPGPC